MPGTFVPRGLCQDRRRRSRRRPWDPRADGAVGLRRRLLARSPTTTSTTTATPTTATTRRARFCQPVMRSGRARAQASGVGAGVAPSQPSVPRYTSPVSAAGGATPPPALRATGGCRSATARGRSRRSTGSARGRTRRRPAPGATSRNACRSAPRQAIARRTRPSCRSAILKCRSFRRRGPSTMSTPVARKIGRGLPAPNGASEATLRRDARR